MRLKKIWGRTTVRGHTNSWETWPLWNRGSDYCPRSFRKMPHRRATDIEPMDRILLWAQQPPGQWRSISTELYPDRHRFNDYHLQHSSDWNSQWDPWQTSSEEKNPGSLQKFLICATKGENWERKGSNLKDLRNTGKWTTTSRGAWKRLKKTG